MTSLKVFSIICILLACTTLAMEKSCINVMRYTDRLFRELEKEKPCLDAVGDLIRHGASLTFKYRQGVLNAGEFVLLQNYPDPSTPKDLMLMFHDRGFKYNRRNVMQAVLSGSFTKLAVHVFLCKSGRFTSVLKIAKASRNGCDAFKVKPVLEHLMANFNVRFPEDILEKVIDRDLCNLLPVLVSYGLEFDVQVSDFLLHSSEDMMLSAVLCTGRTDFSDILGVTLLQRAIEDKMVGFALFLLDKGADPNQYVGSHNLLKLTMAWICPKEDRDLLVLTLIYAGACTEKLPEEILLYILC